MIYFCIDLSIISQLDLMHTHTHTDTHIHTYIHTQTSTHTHIHEHIHTYTHTHIKTHITDAAASVIIISTNLSLHRDDRYSFIKKDTV